ncbi:MAG TPA: SRPBCC family protein [Conexibacter sp.]|jgi:carbon monoxide dehydrogenase subunit G|nr:SRPBCC family protein [Conexibacter sp.]
MASIRREIVIDVRPEVVWDALRDWGAVHTRLVPGFLTDARVDGEDRIVTFFDGTIVRELFVDLDEEARRVVWAVGGGEFGLAHYNASAQVLATSAERTRFVWIADLLPHELAPAVGEMMEKGIGTVKRTLEGAAAVA